MLKPDMLIDVLDTAQELGVSIEYVETNSSWFYDHLSALDMLRNLRTHGLNTLLVSISPFHVEYIPFAKVKGVIRACQQTGMNIFPWISDFYDELDKLPDDRKHKMQEYIDLFGDQWPQSVLNRYWLSTGGRTLDLLRTFSSRRIPLERLRNSNHGCHELTETGHFHVDLYGYYIPGLCTGLGIQASDLGSELNPQDYPLITLLYNNGINGLLTFAETEYGYKAKHNAYVAKCELCAEIRTFLVNEKNVKSKELHPQGHYDEINRAANS